MNWNNSNFFSDTSCGQRTLKLKVKMRSIYRFKLPLFLLGFLLYSTSCEVLDQSPQQDITPDLAFQSEKSARAALIGLYNGLQSGDYYGAYFQYTADNYADVSIYLGFFTGYNEVDDKNIPSSNLNVELIWLQAYETINVANEIIDNVPLIEENGFEQAEKDEIIGAAKCVRALCYLDLLTHYGEHWDQSSTFGLPLITKSTGGDFANVEFVPRNTVSETYDFILADLLDAEKVLPDSDDRTVASLGLTQALLARTYLFKGEYANAISKATAVIDNSNYALIDSYLDIFSNDQSGESIFELVYNSLDPSSLALYTIRRDEVRPDPELVASFETGDTRASLIAPVDGFVGDRFIKAEDFSNDENPAYIVRMAEMYLARAEAKFLSGDAEGALADLNAVRTRAGLSAHTNPDDFVNKLLDEIRWEFFAEGQRFRALVRLGKAEEVLGLQAFQRAYPIPFRELNIEGNQMEQNPGY